MNNFDAGNYFYSFTHCSEYLLLYSGMMKTIESRANEETEITKAALKRIMDKTPLFHQLLKSTLEIPLSIRSSLMCFVRQQVICQT